MIAIAKSDRSTSTSNSLELTVAHLNHFGFWLQFHPLVAARFEAETGNERIAHLRWSLWVGLCFYNIYSFTDLFLVRDWLVVGLVLRLLVITPFALALASVLKVLPGAIRETAVTVAMTASIAVPIISFGLSADPMSSYTFLEMPLTLVFGCMMMVLRFPAATVFTAISCLMTLVAILVRHRMGSAETIVLSIQLVTAAAFVLVGNYKVEAMRRKSYLESLRERLQSEALEKDRATFATMSNTDFLTGLGNRRYFDDAFASKISERQALAVLMIDVDYFKLYNDNYGHPAGDVCLKGVAVAMRSEIRSEKDVLARYGGEEFVAILSGGTIESTKEIAERLRQSVEKAGMSHAARSDGREVVTVSVGAVFVAANEIQSPDRIMQIADSALYDAKHLGRNTSVVLATGQVDQTNVQAA